MKFLFTVAAAALLSFVAGCATSSLNDKPESGGATATCCVCQHNNDLACVCVHVKESTPKLEHQGQTYYFCSEECRAAFAKRPAKYLPKRAER